MVAWRPEIERMVLDPSTRAVLDTAVARPALTYGAGCGIWSGPFGEALKAARSGSDGASKKAENHAPGESRGELDSRR